MRVTTQASIRVRLIHDDGTEEKMDCDVDVTAGFASTIQGSTVTLRGTTVSFDFDYDDLTNAVGLLRRAKELNYGLV